tara:strand:- start:2459 stop:3061 length:603 start_codon:yes stop_codon:yes gene_type:complete
MASNILKPYPFYSRNAVIERKPRRLYGYTEPIIPMLKGETILDAGAGNGIFIPCMLEKGMKVTAIDYSKPSIKYIKNKYPEVKAYVHNIKRPIPEKSFDQILCHLVLHYLEDWIPTLKEFVRLSRSIILCISHPFYTGKYIDNDYRDSQVAVIPFGGDDYMPIFHKSLETIQSIFKEVGLTIVDVREPSKPFLIYELRRI